MNFTGQILISLPNIKDTRFYKTVIYICAHSKEGAMGIIINKSLEIEMYPNLLKQLGIENKKIDKKILLNYGGPVEPGRGFVLHTDDFKKNESVTINSGIVLTSTADIFNDLSRGSGPSSCILALGYTGWGPDQLENEIYRNGWMHNSVNSEFIFESNLNNKWDKAYELLGVNPLSLIDNFGHA